MNCTRAFVFLVFLSISPASHLWFTARVSELVADLAGKHKGVYARRSSDEITLEHLAVNYRWEPGEAWCRRASTHLWVVDFPPVIQRDLIKELQINFADSVCNVGHNTQLHELRATLRHSERSSGRQITVHQEIFTGRWPEFHRTNHLSRGFEKQRLSLGGNDVSNSRHRNEIPSIFGRNSVQLSVNLSVNRSWPLRVFQTIIHP